MAGIVSTKLGLAFQGNQYDLERWGRVDDYSILSDQTLVFLEIETRQKHPCTNVLKLWPILETQLSFRFLLIQVFFPDSPGLNSSRGNLGSWLGEKMEKEFPSRFFYRRLVISKQTNEIVEGSKSLEDLLGRLTL